jgi:mono/diheme cytochrome c family protein
MSRIRVGIAVALVAAFAAVGAGCGGDDNTTSPTTTPATTTAATTTAATTTAATTTAATTTAATTTAATTTAAATGDVAAGKTFFAGTCQSCHLNGGTQAGVGPVLAGGGRSDERIRNQVIKGGGAMPPGLATGADLDNVVAFVLSIQ